MANTFTLITSNVLASDTASVTFSAIPSTYTDLSIRVTGRSTAASILSIVRSTYNGSGGTAYSYTDLNNAGGSAAASGQASGGANFRSMYLNGNSTTANAFGTAELYIPNYAGSTYKIGNSSSVTEDSSTNNYIYAIASLWQDTAAITSVSFTPSTGNFLTGSSFYLYGIKKN